MANIASLVLASNGFWAGLWGFLAVVVFLLLFRKQVAGLLEGTSKPGQISYERVLSVTLIVGSIALTAVLGLVSTSRPLTHVEGTLFQGIALLIGLIGSILFGRQSATAAATEIVRPHARSAFRRVVSLGASLGRLSHIIDGIRSGVDGNTALTGNPHLNTLAAVVTEQTVVATDALEDWRDLIPEEVAKLERELHERFRKTRDESP